jgi:prepilin-type N-terminal cleavage/methylation domain-containing protein
MSIKTLLKRKSFTLIEVLIALSILGLIMGEGLYMLSQQVKQAAKTKKSINLFFRKRQIFLEFQTLFCHLYPFEKQCLQVKDHKIGVIFDAGVSLDPQISGLQKGHIEKRQDKIYFVFDKETGPFHEKLLAQGVKEFSIKFFNQAHPWQNSWASEKQGLPEMIHIKLVTSTFTLDQKFFLPFNLKAITPLCKSSPLSFL